MCLYTTQKEPKIAQEDITCYKVIRKNMTSLIYGEITWKIGKLYKTIMKATEEETRTSEKIRIVKQAFHSYESLEALKEAYYMVTEPCLTVKCTIPKGSRFYRGKHDYIEGYASDQLIINEVIDAKELYPDFDWDNYPYKEGQAIKYKKFNDNKWENYQITNIQPSPLSNNRVDLIAENSDTLELACIITKFDGKAWQTDWESC